MSKEVEVIPKKKRNPQNVAGRVGRPASYAEVVNYARRQTIEAFETIVDIMGNGSSDAVRLKAAELLLDRGWGKAPAFIKIDAGSTPKTVEQAKRELMNSIAQMLPPASGPNPRIKSSEGTDLANYERDKDKLALEAQDKRARALAKMRKVKSDG